jgi:hypothetical protein
MVMLKKSRIILLAGLMLLAFAQVAFPALRAVGPVLPDTDPGPGWSAGFNGFPMWYRDTLGRTVQLAVPPNPESIPDPVIAGNAFSAHIGFGSEAMYWHSTAIIDDFGGVVGNQALLVLALEAAFAGGDAAPGDQIVFARVRIRIDIPDGGEGTYTVLYPYGTKTYTVAAGRRAINDTIDVGIGAPGVFTGALQGDIGPFLVQVGLPPGSPILGDAATLAQVTGSAIPNATHASGFQNFFEVLGPGPATSARTDLFVTGARLFAGTPFTITRTTFSRGAGGTFVEVFGLAPAPFIPGVALTATLPGQGATALRRFGNQYYERIQFATPPNPFVPGLVTITGTTNGLNPTSLTSPLTDVVSVIQATYNNAARTLIIAATSTDTVTPATLTASGWSGAGAGGQPLNPGGAPTTFVNVPLAPATIVVRSSGGGTESVKPVVLP